jgi:hypothetical protein
MLSRHEAEGESREYEPLFESIRPERDAVLNLLFFGVPLGIGLLTG